VVLGAGARLESNVIVLPGARIPPGKVLVRGAVARGRPAPAVAQAPAGAAGPHDSRLRRAVERLRSEPLKALQLEIARLRAMFVLRRCRRGARVFAFGDVRVENRGEIVLGDRVGFRHGMTPTELVCHEGARVSVGAGSFFNYAASIEAHESVTIGARCMIASMTRIADAADGARGPIVIGDDV
jgi:acetyltransferase-like isoleucine patch superfamily enzyme